MWSLAFSLQWYSPRICLAKGVEFICSLGQRHSVGPAGAERIHLGLVLEVRSGSCRTAFGYVWSVESSNRFNGSMISKTPERRRTPKASPIEQGSRLFMIR